MDLALKQVILKIIAQFGLSPDTVSIEVFGNGHIHDTYRIDHQLVGEPPLILQRMNHYVFKDIPMLMHNMEMVTGQISENNMAAGLDPRAYGIVLYRTPRGESWVGNERMGFWRMLYLIGDQIVFETAEDPSVAYEGGAAIAKFQSQLTGLDPGKIRDTIPNFLDLRTRLEQFREALDQAHGERREHASELISIVEKQKAAALEVYAISESGDVPVRVTHNDTKFNNILFDQQRKATCMIDLDTVMKGYAWYDFGDALRTCASTAPEDEAEVSRIGFDKNIFKGFAEGYLSIAKDFLTSNELSILHRAPGVFTFMQGVRFLADYLNNDVYYKTEYPEHNFVRARAQFALMQCQLEMEAEMEAIIKATLNTAS